MTTGFERHSFPSVVSACLRRVPHRPERSQKVVLLDTFMGSENSGDHIIMSACQKVASDTFGHESLLHIPTHYYVEESEHLANNIKVLCGTNILYSDMSKQQQWALPRDLHSYQNVCLLGVGLNDIGIECRVSPYSKLLYKALLSRELLHSVRDEKTKRFLNGLGFDNVVNTACPTMWALTPQLQDEIPREKADTVITSITDYCFDPVRDKVMLGLLKREYRHVIVWVQGSHDLDWCLEKIVDTNDFELIGPDVSELDSVLVPGEVDYVGTRLHAGIRALSHRVRTLIVAVDNRARQIALDTGLPTVERDDLLADGILRWIAAPYRCEIRLPLEAIARWKTQFTTSC